MSKIPEHAKKVFSGVVHDVYQWEQTLYDGTTTTFECLKRPNTIVVLPMVDGEVWYGEQTQPGKAPFLSLFGGRADPGEAPLYTAKRELKEETGLESEDWTLYKKFKTPGKIEWHIYYYIAKNCRIVSEQQLDGGEKIVIKKTSVDDFIERVLTNPNFKEHELQNEVLSTFNIDAAKQIQQTLLG